MNDMEYQQLILNGYMNHRKYLVNHYTREAKRANDNDIPQDEFIARCRAILGAWEADLKRQLNERKKELQQIALLDKSKNEYCKNELANLTLDSFTVYLPAFTNNQLIGYLTINDIKELQKAIDSIQDRTNDKQGIELKSLCLFLYHKSGFDAPAKNNVDKWQWVLNEFGFKNKFTASSIGKTFNEIAQSQATRKNLNPKNYKQAETLFELFPDDVGLKNLLQAKEYSI
jgi:hypothetical protein